MSKKTGMLNIPDVPLQVMRALRERARHNNQSVAEVARDILLAQFGPRTQLLREIRNSWHWQTRSVTAEEIESGIQAGRD